MRRMERNICGTVSETKAEAIHVPVATVQVARLNDRCAWFDFSEQALANYSARLMK
jgi:hypothetical protein